MSILLTVTMWLFGAISIILIISKGAIYYRKRGYIMSNEHKLNYLALVVLIVLISMIAWLVWVNSAGESQNGLQCVYNCDRYSELLGGLK